MDLILGIIIIILVLILFNKDIVIEDNKENKESINISQKIKEIVVKIKDSFK